jgi:hypothetical protein
VSGQVRGEKVDGKKLVSMHSERERERERESHRIIHKKSYIPTKCYTLSFMRLNFLYA